MPTGTVINNVNDNAVIENVNASNVIGNDNNVT